MIYEKFDDQYRNLIFPADRKDPFYREKRDLYFAAMSTIEAEFKAALEDEYGTQDSPKKDLLFQKAWDAGHSSGYYSVENQYEDLSELIVDKNT